jgi:hypothetical protein
MQFYIFLKLPSAALSALGKQPLLSPAETQTPHSLSAHTPRKQKYKTKTSALIKENEKLSEEIGLLHGRQNLDNVTTDDFAHLCDKFLTPEIAKFVKVQLYQIKRSDKGRRYTFCLPSPRALQRFVEKTKFSVGLNKILKIKADKMDELDKKNVSYALTRCLSSVIYFTILEPIQ